jgi:hypothetical protein
MKGLRFTLAAVFFFCLTLSSGALKAQCAMCTANAEASVKNGNTEGNGLNKAILYLLAAPYIAVAGVGYVWYKKYRKRNIVMNMKSEPIGMN